MPESKPRPRPPAPPLGALALLVMLSSGLSGPVLPVRAEASSAGESGPDPRATEKVFEIADTVFVSGDRLPADSRRVAAAITTLGGEDLWPNRGVGIDEALLPVPGILASSRSGGTDVRITARGFGARGAGERSNAGTTRGIRILLDGSPLTEPDGRTSLDLADPAALERITILRSNGSVLFGSASGGVIDLRTPSAFRAPFTEVTAGGGSFGLRRWAVSQGLTGEATRVYLGAGGSTFDGWRRHSESDRTSLRGSLFFYPSPTSEIELHATGTHNFSRVPGALTDAEATDSDSARRANPDFVTRNERRDNRIVRVSSTARHRYASGRLLELGGFVEPKTLHRSERNRYRDFQRIHEGVNLLHDWTFAPSSRLGVRWRAGADGAWQDGSTVFYDLGPQGTRGTSTLADKREAIRTAGIYTELEGRWGPRTTVTLGVRRDEIRYIYDDHIDPGLDARKTFREWTPRGAVAVLVHPRHTAWAAVTAGLEAPAFNEVDPPPEVATPVGLNPIMKPARSLTFEGGVKGDLGGGSDYEVTAYTLEVRNDIIPWDGGAYYFMNGRSRRTGVEIASRTRISAGLSLRIAAALTRNKYVDYRNDLGNFDGNWSAGIPGRSANATARWEPRPGFYLEALVRHCGPYFADDANTARVRGWTIVNGAAGARLQVAGVSADVAITLQNITDRLYVESAWINGANGRYYEPGLPRNVSASVTLRRG